ncbi:hypothetical protein HUJ04_010687 [Dendroctonus ponderosae]|nr:hypothetical protein HUJ04_010687 [Dendroctonus ponderosae]KAH1021136.1 hypothetical protein HUJ04_010687 [Dendroctonus ponderosae]
MELIRTPKVEKVRMLDRYSKSSSQGTLYLTATHLIFVNPDAKKETWVPHMHIATLEKQPLTTTGSPLLIRTKTFLSVTFVIPKERECHDIFITLQQLSQPSNVEELYCFTYKSDEIPKNVGWNFFDLQAEYQRMGVPNDQWALTKLNKDYEINAMANRAAGKGYENEAFYENIKFHFLGVENIHVMRNSLLKVVETCEQKNPTMNSFLSGLESSGWVRHIKSILDTSLFIAEALEEGISVVVHCSDGWDRTAQVCSIATLLLDPYYRTISGYQALIEKDWLAFGHKFSDRCGHIQTESKEISPIFTQLLDATWQLMQQFPCTFQFNDNFLLTIHDHVHSCQSGTFVGNCEKDRVDLRVWERSYSLWGLMANHLDEYLNPLYDANETPGALSPQLIPQNIRFWRGMYYRFESGVHPRESTGDLLVTTADHSISLDDHRITSVKNLISKTMEKKKTKPTKMQLCNNVHLDNKLMYEKATSELENAEHDHPLKSEILNGIDSQDIPKIDELSKDFDSVAIDWKAMRSSNECNCTSAFDHLSKKNFCRKCGDMFCMRCLTKQMVLPGHLSQKPVPVCKPCFDHLSSLDA